jgi:hypothetical protein
MQSKKGNTMKIRVLAFLLLTATAASLTSAAQTIQQLLPASVEKDLAARASDVTEVTLGKNMLDFAAKFMNGKNDSDAATRQLIMANIPWTTSNRFVTPLRHLSGRPWCASANAKPANPPTS